MPQNKLDIDDRYLSTSLYACKAMAILSVIMAHTTMVLQFPFSTLIKQHFSSIGVIVFMILSGYLYKDNGYGSFGTVVSKKAKSVCVPWLIFGSIAYLWGQIHSFAWSNLSVFEWVKYLLGYKTFLYYIPMLLLCYLIFYKTNKPILITSMIVSVVSLELTAFGVMTLVISALHITNYLNIFNWVGFFALGIMCRQYDLIRRFMQYIQSRKVISAVLIAGYFAAVLLIGIFVEKDQAGYFSKTGFIMELFAFIVILRLSMFRILRSKAIMRVAGYSYTVYLIHTMVLSVVMYVPVLNSRLSFLLPLIVLIVACFGIYVLEWIFQKLHAERIFGTIFGIRAIKKTIE